MMKRYYFEFVCMDKFNSTIYGTGSFEPEVVRLDSETMSRIKKGFHADFVSKARNAGLNISVENSYVQFVCIHQLDD